MRNEPPKLSLRHSSCTTISSSSSFWGITLLILHRFEVSLAPRPRDVRRQKSTALLIFFRLKVDQCNYFYGRKVRSFEQKRV